MSKQIVQAVADVVGDARCLVALGGGADSAALLWAVSEAVGSERVSAVFIHHGLEGSDDLRDAALHLAQALDVECMVIERPIPDGGNLEARARVARYDAIEAIVQPGMIALTAHTSDDQAETVLMRLFRGSGTGAMSGIPAERGVWRRPLLKVSRSSLRSLAQELELPFTDDPANSDRRFMRSRIRHDVMPVIEAECGPDVRPAINRSAGLLAADDELLEAAASEIPILEDHGSILIPIGPLRSSSDPIRSRAVRTALRMLLDGYPGASSDVGAVLEVAKGGSPIVISESLRVALEPPHVVISPQDLPAAPTGFSVAVGSRFTWSGSRFSVHQAAASPAWIPGGRFTVLDADSIGETMSVRGPRPGDRIDIDGGSTPVKEVLRAAGISARRRPHSLVVEVGGKIAALAGVRTATWARPKRDKRVVIIEREEGTWT